MSLVLFMLPGNGLMSLELEFNYWQWKDILILCDVQYHFRPHSILYPMDNGGSFLGMEWLGCETDHKVKNVCSCMSSWHAV
jgi:hypothetical protein